jgi:hypothetical protein
MSVKPVIEFKPLNSGVLEFNVFKDGENIGFISKLQRGVDIKLDEYYEVRLWRGHQLCVFIGEYEELEGAFHDVKFFAEKQNFSDR